MNGLGHSNLPHLLEGRTAPPEDKLASYRSELRGTRSELIDDWRAARPAGGSIRGPESAADSLVHLVLLQAFIRGRDPASAPSVARLLHELPRPSVRAAYRAVCNAIKNPLLRFICSVGMPTRDLPIPGSVIKRNWAQRLVEETNSTYGVYVPVTMFGEYHQLCMERAPEDGADAMTPPRHSLGIHYTPPALVDYLTCRALQFMTLDRRVPVDDLRIFDPACGCGAFLVAAFRFLAGANDALGVRDKLMHLFVAIRGCDVDRVAATLALQSLLLTAWESCLRQRIDGRHTDRIRSLGECVRCTDFLRGRAPFRPGDRPNIILGGPPFVRIEQLHRSHANHIPYYRDKFATARIGQFNLYMLFIERALKMLAPGGCLAMSVSGSFLRSKSGRVLRGLVSDQCRIIEIVEFDDRSIYPDAGTHLVLLSAWKTDERSCSRYVFVKGAGRSREKLAALCRQGGRHDDVLVRPFPSCGLTADDWRFDPPACDTLLNRMATVGVPLAALPATISLGVCTGADDVFVLRHMYDKKSRLVIACHRTSGEEIALESDATRRILRGRGILAYGTRPPGFVCVFPYDHAGVILDESTFARRFPRAYEYLASQRSELLKRHRHAGRPWYALRTVDIARAMVARKLVASVIGRPASFTFDVDGVLCHNSTLTISVDPKMVDPYFLLAVLNSRPMRLYVRCRTMPMGEGRCAYRLDAVRLIPIPVPGLPARPDVCAAVARYAQILTRRDATPSRRRALQRQIDRLVMQLYGLSGRDASCVEEAEAIAG
jgi:hypothetical protein